MPLADRREQLLDAALRIIDRDGYRAVSIDAIARELDVTRPVVYRAFDGLGPLLTALLDRQEQRALRSLMRTLGSAADARDPAAALRHAIVELVAMVREDPTTWKPILLSPADAPDVVQRRIAADRDLVRDRFRVLVTAAQAGTGFPRGADPDVVAHALLGLAEYFGRLLLDQPDAVDAATLADTITALVGVS
jgi:AcrR family transcriptional regulator